MQERRHSSPERWHHFRPLEERVPCVCSAVFRACFVQRRGHRDRYDVVSGALGYAGTSTADVTLFPRPALDSPGSLLGGLVVSGYKSLSSQWLGRLQELASLTAGNVDCLCPCLSSLPLSFRSLSLFSSGLCFPTGSLLGLVSQVLSLAQPKTRHMTHARPVRLSSESLNPKKNNWEQDVVRTDSSRQQCMQETAHSPRLSGSLVLWLLAPFLSEAEPCTLFFHSFLVSFEPFSKFLKIFFFYLLLVNFVFA